MEGGRSRLTVLRVVALGSRAVLGLEYSGGIDSGPDDGQSCRLQTTG